MEQFFKIVSNFGFPIAVAGFLLFRLEKKLDQFNNTLINMMNMFIKH